MRAQEALAGETANSESHKAIFARRMYPADRTKDRYTVQLDSGEAFKLKPANVRAEGTGGASGAGKAKKGKGKKGRGGPRA